MEENINKYQQLSEAITSVPSWDFLSTETREAIDRFLSCRRIDDIVDMDFDRVIKMVDSFNKSKEMGFSKLVKGFNEKLGKVRPTCSIEEDYI